MSRENKNLANIKLTAITFASVSLRGFAVTDSNLLCSYIACYIVIYRVVGTCTVIGLFTEFLCVKVLYL